MISCPACGAQRADINRHLDESCGEESSTAKVTFTFKAKRKAEAQPLAERMRPKGLEEIVGHETIIGERGYLMPLIKRDPLPSFILTGPPGTGKTTLARIIARKAKARFHEISATDFTVAQCKKLFEAGGKKVIFVDEIHRLNKGQQDIFLPVVESGSISLIGATTENPSFRINNALLSRCRLVRLERLGRTDILLLLHRATNYVAIAANALPVLESIADIADGDARIALNYVETLGSLDTTDLNLEQIKLSLNRTLCKLCWP